VADIRVKRSLVQLRQVLAIDLMFIEKSPFLIGVATPLDLTMVTSLTSLDTGKTYAGSGGYTEGNSVLLRGAGIAEFPSSTTDE
jgi:hypothetical protein